MVVSMNTILFQGVMPVVFSGNQNVLFLVPEVYSLPYQKKTHFFIMVENGSVKCFSENHPSGELCTSKYLFSLKCIAQIWSDFRCYPSCSTGGINGFGPSCSPECFQYRGTMDVFSKVTKQASPD